MKHDDRTLRLQDISIRLNDRPLVSALDLIVEPCRVTTVMGPSGCGKSSLLAFVAGILEPAFDASGTVLIGGDDVSNLPPDARRFGLLFQDALLFPHLSVGENLAFGLAPRVTEKRQRRQRVENALREAELDGFADRDPASLSGGQQARVALMRTLLSEPRALLLDEPFSKLDAGLKERIRRFVFDHTTARGLPVLLVTHDPADADAAGGPILHFGSNT